MERLAEMTRLAVRQNKEWGEILTGFETKNSYTVMDSTGRDLYVAAEESGSTLLRIFLKALRPFRVHILSTDGKPLMELSRPFRFYFHRLDIYDKGGRHLGTVQRRFSILRRIYSVLDKNGQELFQLFGPLLHPWTFNVRKNGRELGKITKKWSGLMKEGFTDADNFGVIFSSRLNVDQKSLLLGAVFLIDFVHFENKGNN
jgi:uncharacterized protein YxjI